MSGLKELSALGHHSFNVSVEFMCLFGEDNNIKTCFVLSVTG